MEKQSRGSAVPELRACARLPDPKHRQRQPAAHRVSDLAPSSSRPQMSRLPVRVKALFMAPVPARVHVRECKCVEQVGGGRQHGRAGGLAGVEGAGARLRCCEAVAEVRV